MDNWRTSSYSSGGGGQCVEAASADGTVMVRDSTDHDGSTLTIPRGGLVTFPDASPVS
jgi:hypothetical protein